MKIAIVIVIYNRKPIESETLKTINNLDLGNAELVIWNNGPKAIDIDCLDFIRKDIKWDLINTVDNIPLSHIYNKFISDYQADKYVILDQDSFLTQDYFNDINKYEAPLLLPLLTSNGNICSPNKLPEGKFYNKKNKKVSAKSSGLVLHSELVASLNNKYGASFDKNFAFYFIDTTFMLRMKKLRIMKEVRIISGFEHSLSKNELESDEIKLFREKEMAYGTALTLRHYPSWSSLRRFLRKIRDSLKGKNRYPVIEMFSCLIKGNHPKCR